MCIVGPRTYNCMYCRSKDIKLYVLYVQINTNLFIVDPRTYNFMYCRSKDLLLYIL